MWRAITAAGLALAIAACSSGNEDTDTASGVGAAVTTSTTVFEPADLAEFSRHLDPKLEGEDETYRAAAYDLAVGLCDLLDATTADRPGDDSAESDAAVAQTMSEMALNMVGDQSPSPEVTTVVLRLAVGDLCPQHTGIVAAYLNR